MPSKVYSAAISGLDAKLVEVEADVSRGLRAFSIVGLPDKAVEESKERIGAAIKSSKLLPPHSRTFRTLINLAPADLKKEGSLYDLPIALAFLVGSKQTKFNSQGKMFLGELSLNGKLKPIKGALAFAFLAKEKGFEELILPRQNAGQAALVGGVKVLGADSLNQVISHLENKESILPHNPNGQEHHQENSSFDIGWVKGQEYAKRALEITAAGAHNLFFLGPPGAGKSLLAKALPSILPPLSREESLEVTKIYSIAGLLAERQNLICFSPFRSPHHTSSETALIGGGNPVRFGELTLAHRGVLFMDEFPEFHRDVLESLRQPLEEGKITVARAKYNYSFPCRFMLVAASNPCPCGFHNSPDKPCVCAPSAVSKYKRKLSGPLMDRVDIFIEVPTVKYDKLSSAENQGQSDLIKKRVQAAREMQKLRFGSGGILTNSEMQLPEIKKFCQYDLKTKGLLKNYVDSGKLSARGYHRVLKVARTIADLEQSDNIQYQHVAEALMYRAKINES